ncbi:hypothetical protein ACRS6B_29575 [Nocardia asteroides]
MVNPFYNMSLGFPDYSQFGSTVLRNLTNWISGEELKPDINAASVQDRYNQQRDGVRTRAAEVGFQGEFRPREVLDADEFERHGVATLREKVDRIDLKAVGDLVSAWNTIADRHQTSLNTFVQAMARATDESVWRGEARNAAATAVGDYAAKGAQVSNAARLTSNKLSELLTGLEPTKQLVPHAPEHRSGIGNALAFVAGRGWRNDDVAEYNAKTEALRVLRTVYAPVVMESDTNVPVIPRPDPVANPSGVDNGSGPQGTNSGNPSGTPTSPNSNPLGANPTDNPANPSSTQPTDTSSQTPESTSTDPSSTTQDSTTPASTTPASTTPTPSTVPNTPGTPGNPGPGSPGTPGNPTGPGAPGVSVSPRSTSGNPNATSAARNGATPGRAGMSGMPGAMAPGARGGKSDDETSKGIPDYLITQEHGNELTGLNDLPGTVPPVIGDNPR